MKPIAILTLVSGALAALGCAAPRAATFATPEEAVQRLVKAGDDRRAADELLGPGGFSLLRSGDDVSDRQDIDTVMELAQQKLAFDDLGEGRKLALLGKDGWEFPIPLVLESGRWHFDVEAGREEILNRRIGRNELSTIATLHALVDAQHEYVNSGQGGDPPAFAQRIVSSEGRRDGLYWPVAEGETPSPLGPLVADAFEEGYRAKGAQSVPYHGYFFRLLTDQGANALGGATNYLDANGRLTRGFAFVAWPATYDNSGVMTFLVNSRGIVFQKDLGIDTSRAVAAILVFNLDKSWSPTSD